MRNYLDALIKNLEALRDEENPNFGKVIKLVAKTAVDQKLTYDVKRDMLECLLSLDGLTPDEMKLLKSLDEEHNRKA